MTLADDAVFRWAGLLLGQAVILAGLILSYLGTKKKVQDGTDQASTAAAEAAKAVAQTRPISNGFASHTSDALAEITESVSELRTLLVQHIADHASSDLRHGKAHP